MSGEIFDMRKYRRGVGERPTAAPLSPARAALERYHELISNDKSRDVEDIRQVRLALVDKIRRATEKYGSKPQ